MAAITLRMAGALGISRRLAQMPTFRHILESAYDKSPEDPSGRKVTPDDVIPHEQPEKYWAPHPDTGVFGPAGEEGQGGHSATKATNGAATDLLDSSVDQHAWFRTNVDVDVDKNGATIPTTPKSNTVS